jgi:hypothetical protein
VWHGEKKFGIGDKRFFDLGVFESLGMLGSG